MRDRPVAARMPTFPTFSTSTSTDIPQGSIAYMQNIKLSELKAKSPAELLAFAEELEVENASTMLNQ